MADIRSLSRRALTQVREAVEGYRRPTLSGELAGARVALEAAGIDLHVNEASDQLDPELEPVLAWAVREGATTCWAIAARAGRRSPSRPASTGPSSRSRTTGAARGRTGAGRRKGHGLAGLVERTHAIGGTVEAATAPAGGFRMLDVHSRMEAIRVAEERGWL